MIGTVAYGKAIKARIVWRKMVVSYNKLKQYSWLLVSHPDATPEQLAGLRAFAVPMEKSMWETRAELKKKFAKERVDFDL